MGRRLSVRSGWTIAPLATHSYHATSALVSFVVTCAQCQKQVLEGDRIGDEEKCVLSDRLVAVHAQTVQPETPPPVA